MAVTENNYTGDGSTILFSFTFPYLESTDIKVSLDDTLTTEYTLANATTIEFNTAPDNDVAIRIYRDTDDEDTKAVFYPGAAIRAQDLNDNFTQSLYIIQESDRDSGDAFEDAKEALAKANLAITTSNTALADSTTAISTANDASDDATIAVNTGNNAISIANDADDKAQQALDAVGSSLLYVLVPDVASIPSSPQDNDAVEVFDATGIEAFTPLTGVPVGFVGEPGLSVRIVYSTAGSTWSWVQYFPNDPETRYLKLSSLASQAEAEAGTDNTKWMSPLRVKQYVDANGGGGGPGGVTDVTATSPIFSSGGSTPDISIQDGTTAQKGAVQLEDSTSSTSTTTAATPNAVKSAYDLASGSMPLSGGTMTGDITFSGTQTFPGTLKTDVAQTFTAVQTLTDPAIIGTILEDVYTIVDGDAFEVDPSNGSVQLITLGASRTPKATNFAAGESITLMVDDGADYTITWTDTTWGSAGVIWKGGSAPTLATSGYSVIQFWKVGSQVYGASVGDVA